MRGYNPNTICLSLIDPIRPIYRRSRHADETRIAAINVLLEKGWKNVTARGGNDLRENGAETTSYMIKKKSENIIGSNQE